MAKKKTVAPSSGEPRAADALAAPGDAAATETAPDNLPLLDDLPLLLSIELGRTRATLDQVTGFGVQSLIELDHAVGEPVDIRLNGKLFARGEVVTVSENFGVRITELVGPIGEEVDHGSRA
jgi:flagellar motor switch protein FliN/FliY